ncbi:unnamed protein product, partial [Candidula unifasciata]
MQGLMQQDYYRACSTFSSLPGMMFPDGGYSKTGWTSQPSSQTQDAAFPKLALSGPPPTVPKPYGSTFTTVGKTGLEVGLHSAQWRATQ